MTGLRAIVLIAGSVATGCNGAGVPAAVDQLASALQECAIVLGPPHIDAAALRAVAAGFRPDRSGVAIVEPQFRSQLLRLQDAGVAFGSGMITTQYSVRGKQDAVGRVMHGLNQAQAKPGDPDGTGVNVAVVDLGAVWPGHEQFQRNGVSRVTRQTMVADTYHAAHVAGIIGSAGVRSDPTSDPQVPTQFGPLTAGEASKGAAPGAQLLSYAAGDCSYVAAVTAGQVSNFSIVAGAGWERDGSNRTWWRGPIGALSDPRFGRYDAIPRFIDEVAFDVSDHLVVAAAGNDQRADDSPFPSDPVHRDADGLQYPGNGRPAHPHEPDNRDGGLRTVHSWCVGKNVLCVGAVEDDPSVSGDIVPSSYSNSGPTDDGRIKPELVANGTSVMSLTQGPAAPFYRLDTGTSMATPMVSGIAAIVVQKLLAMKVVPSASLVKAVLIHTARDDSTPGPGVKIGWGIPRADEALKVVEKATFMKKVVVQSTKTVDLCFVGGASAQPKVTAVWTDPPGPLVTSTGDDSTSVLVNDIDLQLRAPGVTAAFEPWVLEGARAIQAPNHVDNVEVISVGVTGIAGGTWRLTIRPGRFGAGFTSQEVAVIVAGLSAPIPC